VRERERERERERGRGRERERRVEEEYTHWRAECISFFLPSSSFLFFFSFSPFFLFFPYFGILISGIKTTDENTSGDLAGRGLVRRGRRLPLLKSFHLRIR
jgi:hypothetical protein